MTLRCRCCKRLGEACAAAIFSWLRRVRPGPWLRAFRKASPCGVGQARLLPPAEGCLSAARLSPRLRAQPGLRQRPLFRLSVCPGLPNRSACPRGTGVRARKARGWEPQRAPVLLPGGFHPETSTCWETAVPQVGLLKHIAF